MNEQGNVGGFFNNLKNADEFSGLVGDIRNAVMDYQVCSQGEPIMLMPDTHPQTSLQEDIYEKGCQLIVSLIHPPIFCPLM